MEDSNIEFNNG